MLTPTNFDERTLYQKNNLEPERAIDKLSNTLVDLTMNNDRIG
jgi:hypothetical protein